MSADNGIYILCLKDQFRVIHAQAIDNLYWNESKRTDKPHPKQIINYFKDAPVFSVEGNAQTYASAMLSEFDICEYGISNIDMRPYTWDEILTLAQENVLPIPRGRLEFNTSNIKSDIELIVDNILSVYYPIETNPDQRREITSIVTNFINKNEPMCSCCAGTGKPASGLTCICGGKGTQLAEVEGLRMAAFDAASNRDRLETALKNLLDEITRIPKYG